ncbi:hypothetical protein HV096_17220 [Citrobacter freundii]|nr:hypothetical protein [Citrobacter freundii]MBA8033795.1 hypothetical protein [Citrobacter freundii]
MADYTKKAPRQCGADVYCLSFSSALQMRNRNSLFLNEIIISSNEMRVITKTRILKPLALKLPLNANITAAII